MKPTLILVLVLFFCSLISSQTIVKDISYVSSTETDAYRKERCKLDIAYFGDLKNRPVAIYFHGGGLTSDVKSLPGYYRKLNYIEVAPDYRLSPNAKCPAYLEDAAEAIAWVWNNIERYGGDKSRIIVTGYSAGAYLATMMAMDTTYLKKYDISSDSIWIYFSESAQMTTHFTIMAERGINSGSAGEYIDKYAPLYYKRSVKSYVVLATGDRELDMAGRYDQNTKMYNMLESLGVKVTYWEFPGETHATVGSVARAKFVDELKRGMFFKAVVDKTDSVYVNDVDFEEGVGTLYTVMGSKIKDNPVLSDLKKGVCYIYRTRLNKFEKIVKGE